jgi:hypothetical protein
MTERTRYGSEQFEAAVAETRRRARTQQPCQCPECVETAFGSFLAQCEERRPYHNRDEASEESEGHSRLRCGLVSITLTK